MVWRGQGKVLEQRWIFSPFLYHILPKNSGGQKKGFSGETLKTLVVYGVEVLFEFDLQHAVIAYLFI